MNPEVKKKWLVALKSGKYIRAIGCLKGTPDGKKVAHCCLGVLCEIYIQETGLGKWIDGYTKDTFRFTRNDDEVSSSSGTVLTDDVQKWSGINSATATFMLDEEDKNDPTNYAVLNSMTPPNETHSLTDLNDESTKEYFSDVIPFIEKYF